MFSKSDLSYATLLRQTVVILDFEVFSCISEPQYRCSSNGQWQVATGSCVCGTGFEMALNSTACVGKLNSFGS